MRRNRTMASLVTALAIAGACDSSGNPVAGGRAFLTVPGTANVAVIPYADRDATAAVPLDRGGVPLDAGGRATVYLTQPADVRVEDQHGATVATYKAPFDTAAGVEVLNPGFTGTNPTTGQLAPGQRPTLDTELSNLCTSVAGT